MRPDAYDMMLMGALGGALLVAVPAFALGYWFKRWLDRRRFAKFSECYTEFVQEIKKATPIFRVGGHPAESQEEDEQSQ